MRRAVVAAALALAGCGDAGGPRLDTVEPAEGAVGDTVTLRGAGFCADPSCDPLPAALVSFGIDPQIDGAVVAWGADEIRAQVPAGVAAGDILIVVTVDGRSSNGVSFRVR